MVIELPSSLLKIVTKNIHFRVGDYVALGAHDLTQDCTDPCVLVEVTRVTNHQNYDPDTNDNDIAILELQ